MAEVQEQPPRMGFFTDTSVCIGCKACEVACKEWNSIPEDGLNLTGMSYDNTERLDANTWRHVAFIEQRKELAWQEPGLEHTGQPPPQTLTPDQAPMTPMTPGPEGDFRWLMSSDVCKHCTVAGCLDVCPTGALFRTEFGTVVVQADVCNGCGYCIPACPFGVLGQRESDGRAWKCTLCYDRIGVGLEPACAKACPTDSIQYGPLDELRERAARRVDTLNDAGIEDARLYLADTDNGIGGAGAFFLLLDDPEVYGLPPDPVAPTCHLPHMWRSAVFAAVGLLSAGLLASVGRRR